MSKKKKEQKNERLTKKALCAFFALFDLLVGTALLIVRFALPYFKSNAQGTWSKVCLWSGVALLALGVLLLIVAVAVYRREDARKKRAEEAPATYVPAQEAATLVNVGKYQTFEEKFDQISRMDRTQFVIYVARLFSRKGFQVKLTPVIDNHDIDLLVEKLGVTVAVGCLLTNRVLGKADLVRVRDGKAYYGVNNCMALTNMYFDRSAVEYAQVERMSLVDRNALAEEFMS